MNVLLSLQYNTYTSFLFLISIYDEVDLILITKYAAYIRDITTNYIDYKYL